MGGERQKKKKKKGTVPFVPSPPSVSMGRPVTSEQLKCALPASSANGVVTRSSFSAGFALHERTNNAVKRQRDLKCVLCANLKDTQHVDVYPHGLQFHVQFVRQAVCQ